LAQCHKLLIIGEKGDKKDKLWQFQET